MAVPRTTLAALLAIGLALSTTACPPIVWDDVPWPTQTPCGTDTDGDGVCVDEDCNDEVPELHPFRDEYCFDHIDNDCDGLADVNDPDCASEIVEDCRDGLDNDGDGWSDCDDIDCMGSTDCGPVTCAGQALLRNGDFEAGEQFWTTTYEEEREGVILQGDLFDERSGEWAAFLGGYRNTTETMSQIIRLPAGQTISLSMWFVASSVDAQPDTDVGAIVISDPMDPAVKPAQVWAFGNREELMTNSWREMRFDLSPFAGGPVRLTWSFTEDEDGRITNFIFDDVSVICTAP